SGGADEAPDPFKTPVANLCPNATWAAGYYIGELMPLKPEQYRSAVVVGDDTNVRDGAGFESRTVLTLDRNAPVTIVGEAWDSGCNQWMQVQINSKRHWMNGNTLRLGS
ncbi:MAG TPA: SH3 domain-containing protein, partial [Trichocoleus sp.]